MQAISVLSLGISAGLAVYGYQTGIFKSVDAMQEYVGRAGFFGIFLFTLIQAVQVVIPILPGGISCLGGVLLFGNLKGFLCNYIGICIGSAIAFGIAKYCGKPVLSVLFSQKTIQKYESWTETNHRFAKLFALAIFLPVAPDDFLCYLAGTTRMSWKVFLIIILVAKPWAIAAYSLGLVKIFEGVMALV